MNKKGIAVSVLVFGLFLLNAVTLAAAGAMQENQTLPPVGMMPVLAGSFTMGNDFSAGSSGDSPLHEVYVSDFYMDTHEVTKALWDSVATWAVGNGYDIAPSSGSGKDADHPVYGVSWYEAVKWANARSEMESLSPCYYTDGAMKFVYRTGNVDIQNDWVDWSANGYSLPTEAQWEKAARGGCQGHRFPWCDSDTIEQSRANYYSDAYYNYDTSSTRGDHPAYATGGYPYTAPVGSFQPNGYGLYDTAGNILEWCWDWYQADPSAGENPYGPSSGTYRIDRGGSWYHDASRCPVARRHYLVPDTEANTLGFRLVRNVL